MNLQEEKKIIKDKIINVFKFLQDFNRIKTPPITNINKYQWNLLLNSLPKYPTISLKLFESQENNENIEQDYILKIRRPNKTNCPEPPEKIKEWLNTGWQNLHSNIDIIKTKNFINREGKTYTEHFEESLERTELLNKWTIRREEWKKAEIPLRKAYELFSKFFELWGQIQRESEKYQLYLANGFLYWDMKIEVIDHPLLLQKVELFFDSNVPEFILKETDNEPEFYSSLLRYINVDPKGISEYKEIMRDNLYHPLDKENCEGFLKGIIQRFWDNGKFVNTKPEITEKETPHIYLEPSIILGMRNQGYLEVVDSYIEAIDKSNEIPEALARIVGFEINKKQRGEEAIDLVYSNNGTDFLLTKETNKEQERIIESLERNGTVIVQGPPGTGKSHTIANLIGHLLAKNKTVLVTSETTKALKVIRGQVVKSLRPLCVSLLDNDEESKIQLEESIRGIVSYLSSTDKSKIENDIKELEQKRKWLKAKESELKSNLIKIRRDEYTDIVFAGEGEKPATIAKKLSEWEDEYNWIPEPLEEGAILPLSESEIIELYSTNLFISKENEDLLLSKLPDLSEIPNSIDFKDFSEKYFLAQNTDKDVGLRYWNNNNQEISHLEAILQILNKLSADLNKYPDLDSNQTEFQLEILDAGRKGGEYKTIWLDFIDIINDTTNKIAKRNHLILSYDPEINNDIDIELLMKACQDIIEHLNRGKKLNSIPILLNPKWKCLINTTKVNGNPPKVIEHFEAILALLEINQLRDLLKRRWDKQIKSNNGPDSGQLGSKPEEIAIKYVNDFNYLVNWFEKDYKYLINELYNIGFNTSDLVNLNVDPLKKYTEIIELKKILNNNLKSIVNSRIHFINYNKFVHQKEKWLLFLNSLPQNEASYKLIKEFIFAINEVDSDRYTKIYTKLKELVNLKVEFNKRNELLKKLEPKASNWSKFIRNRIPPHNAHKPPSDVETAWKFGQWKQLLKKRLENDIDSVQKELYQIQKELLDTTANYVEKLAWSAQLGRLDLEKQQALNGWLQLHKKMGKGTGKRVPILRAEAKNLLSKCKNAVPVWIMPFSRVVESFDLSKTLFDVLIVDEASQSDLSALIAFAIAKEVVVVGDNEQVSPYAIGQQIDRIQSLIDEHLVGIPNKQLYDGKTSLYDMASQSFGETIRLIEHFRCVPDIIQFSNHLCYNGEVKPLRDASNSKLLPHLVSHRVSNGFRKGKENIKEAEEITSLVLAMCKIQEYKNKTIGIISLLGNEQSAYINKILESKMITSEYQNRNILCGNAYNFQGDERNIIFLSMVDSAEEGPLRLKQDDSFKKIINVASSRAKDQLWIVHSLNPDTDLKPGDFRLRLLKHAENPKAITNQIQKEEQKVDSEFERLVLRDLSNAGYRVITQWEVGSYRIDLVIEDHDNKIAIECDGDKYHPPEKLDEDMERQMILERLGWRFIRIRGSEYFQNKEKTIQKVISRLTELDIKPLCISESTSNKDSSNNYLKQKVLLLAQEIRDEWKKQENIEDA